MVKYIIEGGIDFYEELYKSFDEPDITAEETNNLCQITGLPLVERFIELECNHKFNYSALYKEIYKQKFIFNTYTCSSLTDSEQIKFKDAKKDYFIKCPYCRNIQFTLLPYYDDMEHEKRYGINSLEMTQSDSNYLIKLKHNNYSFMSYGYTFSNGTCCKVLGNVDGKDIYCSSKMSSSVVEMNKSFCYQHIRSAVKQYKIEQKKKEKEEAREALKKQKEDAKAALKKEKEEAKLLLKLKASLQKISKHSESKHSEPKHSEPKQGKPKKVQNLVTNQGIKIDTFVPDINEVINEVINEDINEVINEDISANSVDGCQSVLKSGLKKGQKCGAKVSSNCPGFCLRHKPKIETKIEIEIEIKNN